MEDLKSTYNKIAEDYLRDNSGFDWWISFINEFITLLPKNADVLDLGCGPGEKSKYLSEKGFRVIGIDFSEKMIELAEQYAPKVEFKQMDIREISKLNMKFDGIIAVASLLHLSRKEIPEVFKTISNILNPSGCIYLAVKEQKSGGKEEEIVTEQEHGYEYSRFFSYFTIPGLTQHLQNISMKVLRVDVSDSGRNNWIQMIARKYE